MGPEHRPAPNHGQYFSQIPQDRIGAQGAINRVCLEYADPARYPSWCSSPMLRRVLWNSLPLTFGRTHGLWRIMLHASSEHVRAWNVFAHEVATDVAAPTCASHVVLPAPCRHPGTAIEKHRSMQRRNDSCHHHASPTPRGSSPQSQGTRLLAMFEMSELGSLWSLRRSMKFKLHTYSDRQCLAGRLGEWS